MQQSHDNISVANYGNENQPFDHVTYNSPKCQFPTISKLVTLVQQGEHYSIESEKRSIIILKQLQNQGTEMRFLWRSSTNCLGAPYYFFDGKISKRSLFFASCSSSTRPS